MLGNPQAQAMLDQVAPDQRPLTIEAITAHEIARCWRYAKGQWHALPSAFVEADKKFTANAELLKLSKAMRETRREEGFSDLLARAWIGRHHPEQYGQSVCMARIVVARASRCRQFVRNAGLGPTGQKSQ